MEAFVDAFRPTRETSILDAGGTPFNWLLVDCEARITLLNLRRSHDTSSMTPNMRYVEGDVTSIPYPDNAFDVASPTPSSSIYTHTRTRRGSLGKSAGCARGCGCKRPLLFSSSRTF
jgi:hypothetical protein